MSDSGNNKWEVLRGYELRLLRCTLSAPPPSQPKPLPSSNANNLHSHINQLLHCINNGHYLQALSSDAAKLLSSVQFGSSLDHAVDHFIAVGTDVADEEKACRLILVMCLAVAAFLCFTQSNFTGPSIELPKCPLPFKEEFLDWDNWAHNQLMSDASDLLGKFSNLQYIVFAKILIMRIKDLVFEGTISSTYGIRTISWWLARVLLNQQRILDERVSSLLDLLQVNMSETLHHFGTVELVTAYWGANLHDKEAVAIVSTVYLEAGMLEYTYGHVDSCRSHFQSAEAAAGLHLSVTGVLGYRTVHQVEAKAQRVLVATKSLSNDGGSGPSMSFGIQKPDSAVAEDNFHVNSHENSEASDVFMTPVLLENGNDLVQHNQNGGSVQLGAIQQAVILAQCLLVEKTARHDELQSWDVAPFIEAIDSQPSSVFTLRYFCDLLRIRWESTRSRTKMRAIEMMDKLVESVDKPLPGVEQRVPLCFVAYIPAIPALRKEYGELLVSCGLIGEALKIFEDLELWDNLIYCNCLLGKKAIAVELIKMRLSETPDNPRLWCSLGDVTNNDSCYEKALEVSKDKSARAKRSLARSAYNRGEYEKSKLLWESAMALNSLYSDGWFALGAAALKARDIDKALDSFTRAVQLDPENGEAWNNIACLHTIKKKSKEAFIAYKEALKLKRDSWQLFENYSHVALDVGNIRQALEAIQTVLHMTSNKRIDAELLEKIMLELEGRAASIHSLCPVVIDDLSCASQTTVYDSHDNSASESEFSAGRSRETDQLVEVMGKILQQIVKSESRPDVWGLYARWHRIKGDLTMCSEAFLKQVRSYQGSELWKDRDRFKKFAHASLDLCKVYMEISSSTGSRRELFAAEMHLKNVVKQAETFSDTEEYTDIQACLNEVKMMLQSGSA